MGYIILLMPITEVVKKEDLFQLSRHFFFSKFATRCPRQLYGEIWLGTRTIKAMMGSRYRLSKQEVGHMGWLKGTLSLA